MTEFGRILIGDAPVSRRRLLRAGMSLAGLAALAACTPRTQTTPPSSTGSSAGSSAGTTPAGPTAKPGGTLVFAETIKIISLDPHKAQQAVERSVIGEVYNGLLRFKAPPEAAPNSVMEADLAESWRVIDDTTYEFKLRQGVKWHNVAPVNGRELVAEDVKFNLERVSSDKPGFPFKAFYPIASIATPDKYTVTVKTSVPYAPFLGYIAFPYANLVPPEVVRENNDDVSKFAVGTGPFILRKFDPNVEAVLEKNPEYFRKGKPYLDGIRMTMLPDKTAAYNAFRARQLDITPLLVPSLITAEQADLIRREIPGATVILAQGLPWQAVRFNIALKPFDDKRVRQAFSLMTDRESLVAKYTAGKGNIIGPLPSSMEGWALPEAQLKANPLYKQDVARAKSLLEAAGVKLPWKVRWFTTTSHRDLTAIIASQWQVAGIELDVTITPDTAVFYATAEKGDFDLLSFGHSGFQDPDDYFSTYLASDGAHNYGKFVNREIDDLIARQRRAQNEAERKRIVTEIQTKVIDEAPFLYLSSTPMHVAAQPHVKGFWVNPIIYGSTRHWEDLWLDK